jgi:hypothetical protein
MSADSGYAVAALASGRTSYRAILSEAELLPDEAFATDPPEPTMADAAAALAVDVQAWLDTTAQGNGYDSLASCISYLSSTVAQYAADAAAALAWRDAVWTDCFQWQQSAAANPPATIPTSAQVIAQLPQPETFGWVVHQPGANA